MDDNQNPYQAPDALPAPLKFTHRVPLWRRVLSASFLAFGLIFVVGACAAAAAWQWFGVAQFSLIAALLFAIAFQLQR